MGAKGGGGPAGNHYHGGHRHRPSTVLVSDQITVMGRRTVVVESGDGAGSEGSWGGLFFVLLLKKLMWHVLIGCAHF